MPKTDYEQGAVDLAERLKTYYNNLEGKTLCALVSYHVDEILKEFLEDKSNER